MLSPLHATAVLVSFVLLGSGAAYALVVLVTQAWYPAFLVATAVAFLILGLAQVWLP